MSVAVHLPETAEAILRPEAKHPGSLDLPRWDQTNLAVKGSEPYPVIAAAIVPNAAIPLPRGADPDLIKGALMTLFGGKVAILAVRVEAILAGDRLEEREGDASMPSEEPSFWGLRRTQENGSEMVPLPGARISRLPS